MNVTTFLFLRRINKRTKKFIGFKETKKGCIVPVGRKLNKDGYFRIQVNGKWGMFHRRVWEEHYKPLKKGIEIDHICKRRDCFNIEHLQKLKASKHRSKDNAERYSKRQAKAKKYWLKHDCMGITLAEKFDVSFSASCKWIRKWKLNIN